MPTALVYRAGIEFEHRMFCSCPPNRFPSQLSHTHTHLQTGEYWVSVLLMSEAGTSLLMCPIFGYLVDRGRTRRLPFISALVMLTGCMLILQLARSIAAFVAARLLQGIAGALVVVAAFALIGDAVPRERLGQTIGYLGSAIASGFLLGPFLGGVVYNSGGYNAVFWFAYPILALDMVMRLVLIEKKVAVQWAGESNGDLESDLETTQRIPSVGPREPQVIQRRKGFVIFRMLKQRRVLISSWALLTQGLLLSAFDAVCIRLDVFGMKNSLITLRPSPSSSKRHSAGTPSAWD
jgi:MFS family permease